MKNIKKLEKIIEKIPKKIKTNKYFNLYIVGGSIRDLLLNKKPNDIDYAIEPKEGINIEELIDFLKENGYFQVGKDFPVFLDKNGDEYAITRKERKLGFGHKDFGFEYDNVSIEDDLLRRDLTINSIAFNVETMKIHFPNNSSNPIEDIKNKKLKPTSEAFVEDPLRFLRIARFTAKFIDFEIDYKETKKLLTPEIKEEIKTLSQERLFQELEKALKSEKPSNYFRSLKELDLLDIVCPDINKMVGLEQPIKYHAEGDVFEHTMYVLDEASKLTNDIVVRYGTLNHDVGKAYTHDKLLEDLLLEEGVDKKEYLSEDSLKKLNKEQFYGHSDFDLLDGIFQEYYEKYKIPKKYINFAIKAAKMHHYLHDIEKLSAKKITKILNDKELVSTLEELENLILVAKADHNGRFFTKLDNPKKLTEEEKEELLLKREYENSEGKYYVGNKKAFVKYEILLKVFEEILKNKNKYQITKEVFENRIVEYEIDEDGNEKKIISKEKKELYIYKEKLKIVKRVLKEIDSNNTLSKK